MGKYEQDDATKFVAARSQASTSGNFQENTVLHNRFFAMAGGCSL